VDEERQAYENIRMSSPEVLHGAAVHANFSERRGVAELARDG
jgi:hypothetical protein